MASESTPLGLYTGERALVTGSASNIGRAIACGLAREGAEVLLADVDATRNDSTAAAIRQAGGQCDTITTDLSQPDAWQDIITHIGNAVPSLFVHSASPPRHEQDTPRRVDVATFDAMVNVGMRAGFWLGRELGKRMVAQSIAGRMLYITSLHTYAPRNLPHYSAGKAGMNMIMKELARDLAPHNIRVNALAPGAVPGGGNTAITEGFAPTVPMRRVGRAEDMVGPALALLSDRFSGYVTGTTLAVDGGLALFNWIGYAEA